MLTNQRSALLILQIVQQMASFLLCRRGPEFDSGQYIIFFLKKRILTW